ncbi:hypothetical protein BKA67DRAFT_368686 [Truncatella angustata]|uniref:Uncharacterized protein n=1 Tax=Truncatella angustata TaxID=152316 RepID=A0A9P8UEZ9_9PEZI|nr:uncharacterized protein BKA67DRAFT_368686 [Truncatella angustata]KAH6648618.1 hypothetical protein BKA67DRAFT_368686 [Truncatella angustata]
MGRKQAPQPLALAEPQSYAHTGSGPNSSNGSTTVSPNIHTLSAPNSSSLRPQEPRGLGVSSETNLQVSPTPTSSKSPRSPRSPFSKFNASSKKTEPRPVHTSHAQSAPVQLQSKFSAQPSSEYPQFDYKAGPVAETYDQEHYHYPRDLRAEDPSELQHKQQNLQGPKCPDPSRPQASPGVGVEAGRTTPTLIREGAGNYQFTVAQQPPPREAAREEEKHSRSASRFFNFKSSKTSHHRREQTRDHRPKTQPRQGARSNDTSDSHRAMSRGLQEQASSDRISTKTSKYSGP